MKSKVSIGTGRVVGDRHRLLGQRRAARRRRARPLRSRPARLALQHGVQALDGGDDTPARAGRCVLRARRWTLYSSVNLRPSSGGVYCLELLMRLLAEVARVDQEQDALRAAELDQAVDRR